MCKIIFLLLLISQFTYSQNIDENKLKINLTTHYGLFLPGLDLKENFGINSIIGSDIILEKNNLLHSIGFGYIFGENVKDSSMFLMFSENGIIVDEVGQEGEVYLYQRGYQIMCKIGKDIELLKENFSLIFGIGFIQYKIKIKDQDNTIPALSEEYLKGYDKLSNGFNTNIFLGYKYEKKKNKFHIGLESSIGFTKNRRSFNFVEMGNDDKLKFDLMNGIKFIWWIPVSKRTTNKNYYY